LDEKALLQIIETLSHKRWKVGLLIEDERGAFDRMWQTHPIPDVERIDLIDELLVDILQRSDAVLGAFYEDDFHEWLAKRIQKMAGRKAVIGTQFDAWLSTCGRIKALEFFKNFAVRDFVIPVLLVTSQHSLVKSSNFPVERLWSVREMEAS
jgi:hypothetical protein